MQQFVLLHRVATGKWCLESQGLFVLAAESKPTVCGSLHEGGFIWALSFVLECAVVVRHCEDCVAEGKSSEEGIHSASVGRSFAG